MIEQPSQVYSGKSASCGIAVMAKSSVPGLTKTRLVPPLTYDEAARERDLARFGPTYVLAESGGKTILTNQK